MRAAIVLLFLLAQNAAAWPDNKILFSPDNKYFVLSWTNSKGADSLSFGTVKDRKFYKSIASPEYSNLLGISSDSKLVAITPQHSAELQMFSMGGELVKTFNSGGGRFLAISKNFNLAVSLGNKENGNYVLNVLRISGDKLITKYVIKDMSLKYLANFSPDSRYLAYTYDKIGKDGLRTACFVNMLDLKTGKSAVSLNFNDELKEPFLAIQFSPDGKLFAYSTYGGTTHVISVPGWDKVKTFPNKGYLTDEIRFSREHLAVLYASFKQLDIYSRSDFVRVHHSEERDSLSSIQFTADGSELVKDLNNGRVRFIKLPVTVGSKGESGH